MVLRPGDGGYSRGGRETAKREAGPDPGLASDSASLHLGIAGSKGFALAIEVHYDLIGVNATPPLVLRQVGGGGARRSSPPSSDDYPMFSSPLIRSTVQRYRCAIEGNQTTFFQTYIHG